MFDGIRSRLLPTTLLATSISCLALMLAFAPQRTTLSGAASPSRGGGASWSPGAHHSAAYYYTRTRRDPNHLRIAEDLKNSYVDEIRHESVINGTRYEYFNSAMSMSHDELVFNTIDKMFQHRLSPFYIYHYDNEQDKRRSSDPSRVSTSRCARDLLYLIDKLSLYKRSQTYSPLAAEQHSSAASNRRPDREPTLGPSDENLAPELEALFDSYGRQEAGIMLGNIYWTGAYDQCVNRHIFDLLPDSADAAAARPRSARRHQPQVVSFKGRYCVSSLKSPVWDKMIESKRRNSRHYFKSERQFNSYPDLFRLQVGVCLPDSCDSNSFERHLDEIKLLTKSMLGQRYEHYENIDLYCLPDESSPLRQLTGSALYFVLFGAFWLGLIFLATLADVFEFVDTREEARSKLEAGGKLNATTTTSITPERKVTELKNQHNNKHDDDRPHGPETDDLRTETTTTTTSKHTKCPTHTAQRQPRPRSSLVTNFVCWFSLRANYVKFMKVAPGPESSSSNNNKSTADAKGKPAELSIDLRFLNAFKALIMFWIVNGHIMLLMIQTAKNILYSDALLNGLMHFLIGATFGVDLFFTMTGFLTSYLLFNTGRAHRMRPSTWLYLSFHRYWRLAPLYLLVFWFSRSVMQLLGSGPLWDYGTSAATFRGLCNHESWWFPATLTSNLHGLFDECMITSWYISNDMQFWLASPIFIHLLARSPLAGWLVSLATILGSSYIRYSALMSEKSARYDELAQPRADIFMRVSHDLPALYTHPHYRISAYIVGLLAGHYVYMVKSGRWNSVLAYDMLAAQRQQQEQPQGEEEDEKEASELVATTGDGNSLRQRRRKPKESTAAAEQQQTTSTSSPISEHLKLVDASRARRNTLAYAGLYIFLGMSFISYLSSHFYPVSWLKSAKTFTSYAYAVDHLLMSVGASLIIVTMCFGQWPRLQQFLSHPNWTRLSKINYSLLLLQCEAIYYQIFRYEQVPVAGTRELINILFNLLVTLYPVAMFVTLAFEFPMANIEKVLLKV